MNVNGQRPSGVEGWSSRLFWMLPLTIVALILWHVLHHYHIKAYSDPLNWLTYARHFGEEFGQNKWPYGFPVFLNIGLKLVGPYYIFLVNLPVILAIYFLVRALTRAVAETMDLALDARWAGLYAFLLIASFDVDRLTYYINPYRDFLSHALLLGSMLLLVRSLCAGRPGWRMAVSGLLLGLAYSVRETALIMAGPMFLYGCREWRRNPSMPAIRMACWFAAGALTGAAPFLLQTYWTTDQLLLPPQSVKQGALVPGMNAPKWDAIRTVLEGFYVQIVLHGLWIMPAAVVGLVAAMRRRAGAIWIMVGLGAVAYAIFYSFYYMYVRRYYYTVFMLATIPAGVGFSVVVAYAGRWLGGRRRLAVWFAPGVALLLFGVAGWSIVRAGDDQPKFQVRHARQFESAVRAAVPDMESIVYCHRNLCEFIRYFTGLRSYPLGIWREGHATSEKRIVSENRMILDAGTPMYMVDYERNGRREQFFNQLSLFFDVTPAAALTTSVYSLNVPVPFDRILFYRVHRWTNLIVRSVLPVEPGRPGVLMMDLGYPYLESPYRTRLDVTVNGVQLPVRSWQGVEFFDVPGASSSEWQVVVESDRPLPAEPWMAVKPPEEPLELRFKDTDRPAAGSLLRGHYAVAGHASAYPVVYGDVELRLPEPVRSRGRWMAELFFRSMPSQRRDLRHVVEFRHGDGVVSSVEWPRDNLVRSHKVALPGDPGREAIHIRRVEQEGDALAREMDESIWSRADGLELAKVLFWPRGYEQAVRCVVGSERDATVVGEGFHGRERTGRGNPARWTTGRAEFRLDVSRGGVPMRLRLDGNDGMRAPGAPPSNAAFTFNGFSLAPTGITANADGDGWQSWWFDVPAEQVRSDNTLVLSCTPWIPSRHLDSRDHRELGIMVTGIEFTPSPVDRVKSPGQEE